MILIIQLLATHKHYKAEPGRHLVCCKTAIIIAHPHPEWSLPFGSVRQPHGEKNMVKDPAFLARWSLHPTDMAGRGDRS